MKIRYKMIRRQYLNARHLVNEAVEKIKDYEGIMGSTRMKFEELRKNGVPCKAFSDNSDVDTIEVTRQCWNHLFKHPVKRRSKEEKLERALCLPLAVKLLNKTTTYQGVSRELDKGGREWLYFEIIGYVRGNRIKVVIRKQEKQTNPKKILFSFYQMSSAPRVNKDTKK
ncbi:hypothetical protein KKF55_05125 [Patescibacteria group bacterium]|nr:hypothetical protein [Patescibacteria group bacterium]